MIDDHPIVIDGIRQVLAGAPDLTIVGAATDPDEGVRLAGELQPDLVILDLKLGDRYAPDTCRALRTVASDARVLIHTAFDERVALRACLEAGAAGVVLKDTNTLVDALRAAMRGELQIELLDDDGQQRALSLGNDGIHQSLTQREYEVLCVLARGRSTKEIAEELCLAENTVRSYTQSLLTKLMAHNRIEALTTAHKLRLL